MAARAFPLHVICRLMVGMPGIVMASSPHNQMKKSGGANITGALDVPAEYSRPMQCGQIRENPAT